MSSNDRLARIISVCSENSSGKRKDLCESLGSQFSFKGYLTENQMNALSNVVNQVVSELTRLEAFEQQLGRFLRNRESTLLKLAN